MATITESQTISQSETPSRNGDAADRPIAPQQTKPSAGRRWNQVMRLVRRVHLYSGLFMFPWVLLYGTTGMFFNHPRALTGSEVRTFRAAEIADGSLTRLPSPEQMAERVVAAVNQSRTEADGQQITLTDFRSPQYNNYLTFSVRTSDAEHTVTINPVTGDGEVHTVPVVPDEEDPPGPLADVRRVEVDGNVSDAARACIPNLLTELGLPSGEAVAGRPPVNLTFSAEVDGEPALLAYNLSNSSLTTTSEADGSPLSTKSFMQRLHLSRGYVPHWNAEWVWAVLVDGMFLSMVFWGVSGLFMWWQIKRTRWFGAGVLLASLLTTVVLVAGMHETLTATGPRGRGGRGHGGGGHGHGPADRAPMAQDETDGSEASGELGEGRAEFGEGRRGGRGRGGGFGRGGSGRGGFNRGGFGRGSGGEDNSELRRPRRGGAGRGPRPSSATETSPASEERQDNPEGNTESPE